MPLRGIAVGPHAAFLTDLGVGTEVLKYGISWHVLPRGCRVGTFHGEMDYGIQVYGTATPFSTQLSSLCHQFRRNAQSHLFGDTRVEERGVDFG